MTDKSLLDALLKATDAELKTLEEISILTGKIKRVYIRKSLEEKLMHIKATLLDEKQSAINQLSNVLHESN